MRLIVTRPEPDATRTAEALIRLGHAAILSPMLDIVREKNVQLPKQPLQAVLVTSSNAVRMLAWHRDRRLLANVPVLAVGDRTALDAKRAGFAGVRSAGGAVDDLIALAGEELKPAAGPLLYAAADVPTGDVADKLRALGFDVHTRILYRAEPRGRLAGVAIDALKAGSADGILFYSRRSAAAFAAALTASGLGPLGERVACFCFSAAVSEPLAAVATGPILVSERPDQISFFALIDRYSDAHAAGSDG
jgi:uroporphyrinogen-III synthase